MLPSRSVASFISKNWPVQCEQPRGVVAAEANNPEGGGLRARGLEGLRQGGLLICAEYKNGITIKLFVV
jgi:hypothetical protein